jgi:histidinol-phosphate aminotransferase
MAGGTDSFARIHGGSDAHGIPLHDFSTNSNACGPCPQALAVVNGADAGRYPDPRYTALREQLAAFHGVESWRIAVAGSASEFIFRITAWVARRGGRSVCLPAHSYGDYAHAAQAWGLKLTKDVDAQRPDLTWLCDPSSPLGTAQPMPAIPEGLGDNRSIAVLDRAYEPLRLSGSPALTATQRDATWQLWTPNKALGLTGVRAAYAIAPARADPAEIDELESLGASWPIGAHGVAMLEAWCSRDVQHWLEECLPILRAWKERQIALCIALGWQCLPSLANFFCVRGADVPALRTRGIKLRDTASFGLRGHARLSVQPPAVQHALENAWRQLQRNAE